MGATVHCIRGNQSFNSGSGVHRICMASLVSYTAFPLQYNVGPILAQESLPLPKACICPSYRVDILVTAGQDQQHNTRGAHEPIWRQVRPTWEQQPYGSSYGKSLDFQRCDEFFACRWVFIPRKRRGCLTERVWTPEG